MLELTGWVDETAGVYEVACPRMVKMKVELFKGARTGCPPVEVKENGSVRLE